MLEYWKTGGSTDVSSRLKDEDLNQMLPEDKSSGYLRRNCSLLRRWGQYKLQLSLSAKFLRSSVQVTAHHGKLDQEKDQTLGSSSDSSDEFSFSRPLDDSVSQLNRALGVSSTLRRVRTEATREDNSSSGEHQLETSLSRLQSRQLEQIVLIPRNEDGSVESARSDRQYT